MEEKSSIHGEKGFEIKKVDLPELNLSYVEKTVELPRHRQERFGIKRIRRKEVSESIPGILWDRHPATSGERQALKIRDHDGKFLNWVPILTEDKLPSPRTWNHIFLGDAGHFHSAQEHETYYESYREQDRKLQAQADRLRQEGLYFQEIRPEGTPQDEKHIPTLLGRAYIGLRVYVKDNDELRLEDTEDAAVFEKSSYRLFPMSCSSSSEAWSGETIRAPLFIFGNQNPEVVEYINSITSNPETVSMLKSAGWTDDVNLANDFFSGKMPHPLPDGRPLFWLSSNLQVLKMFAEGREMTARQSVHPYLPVIHHPNIKPLYWCHAEAAIFPTVKEKTATLNILFFER